MGNYDPKDDERRQRLIVAQSSIKTAIDFFGPESEISLQNVINKADEIFDWVMSKGETFSGDNNGSGSGDRTNSPAVGGGTNSIPTPTLKQKEWIDKIAEKHGFTAEQIYAKCKKYPATKDEAIECVKTMKG